MNIEKKHFLSDSDIAELKAYKNCNISITKMSMKQLQEFLKNTSQHRLLQIISKYNQMYELRQKYYKDLELKRIEQQKQKELKDKLEKERLLKEKERLLEIKKEQYEKQQELRLWVSFSSSDDSIKGFMNDLYNKRKIEENEISIKRACEDKRLYEEEMKSYEEEKAKEEASQQEWVNQYHPDGTKYHIKCCDNCSYWIKGEYSCTCGHRLMELTIEEGCDEAGLYKYHAFPEAY